MGWGLALVAIGIAVLVAWWRVERHKHSFLMVLRECTDCMLDARIANNQYGEDLLKVIQW